MSTQSYDAVATGLSRVTGQPLGKPKFTALLQTLLQEVAEDMYFAASLYNCVDINAASGVQLDVIGRIVGQSRTILKAIALPFFGFASTSGGDYQYALPYGDNAHPTQGGALLENGQSVAKVSQADDALFRRMIAMRILKNSIRLDAFLYTGPVVPYGESAFASFTVPGATSPTYVWGAPKPWIEVLNSALLYIFPEAAHGAIALGVADAGGMHIEIFIGEKPSPIQVSLLLFAGLLPIPQGVNMTATWWDDTHDVFWWDGKSGAAGYGDNVHPSQGAIFAERVG